MEEVAPETLIALLQSEIISKQDELESQNLKIEELRNKEDKMDEESDQILDDIEQIEEQLMEHETLESEEENLLSRYNEQKQDQINLIDLQMEEVDDKLNQASALLQSIQQECQGLDHELVEGGNEEMLVTDGLDTLKKKLEDLMKDEQNKFQQNYELISQMDQTDQEFAQIEQYERQLKNNFENWEENQVQFQRQSEMMKAEHNQDNQRQQQEIDEKLVRQFLQSLRNTNLHQASTLQTQNIETIRKIEQESQSMPLCNQIPTETQIALDLIKFMNPQLQETVESIAKKVITKQTNKIPEDFKEIQSKVQDQIEKIGSHILKQSEEIYKIEHICHQINNSTILSLEKDFQFRNNFSSIEIKVAQFVSQHKKQLSQLSYHNYLANAYSQMNQPQVLPTLYKDLLKQLNNFQTIQLNVLQLCISDLNSIQDQNEQKIAIIPRLNKLIAKLYPQLSTLKHESPSLTSAIENQTEGYIKRLTNAKSVVSKVPSELVTIQTLLALEADLKDIDIEGLREIINEHIEKEKADKIEQARGARNQAFRDCLKARRIKDQREKLKRDIQALQKDLSHKLDESKISNPKAEELLKIKTKGVSEAKLAEAKEKLEQAIQQVAEEAERDKQASEIHVQESQKMRVLQRLNEEIMRIQNQIKDGLKSYDLKNVDAQNLVNDVLQCERLMESEMVDDFEVLKRKLQKRGKRDQIKSQFLDKDEQTASIDEKVLKAQQRVQQAKDELEKVGVLDKKLLKQREFIKLDTLWPILINQLQNYHNKMGENLHQLQDDSSKLLRLTQNNPEQNSQIQTLQKFLQKIQSDLKNDNEPKLRQLRKSQEPQVQLQKVHQLSISQQQKEIDLKNLQDQIAFLLNKYQEQELAQRVSFITKDSDDFKYRIEKVTSLIGIFQELCDEFSGYCSDDYEEDLVKRLQNSDLRELEALLRMICEENDSITDKISFYLRKQQKGGQDKLKEIEDSLNSMSRDISEIERRVHKIGKAFEKIPAVAKILLRDSEVSELERKLGQLEIMVSRVIEESEAILEKHSMDSEKEEVLQEMEGLSNKFKDLLKEVNEKLMTGLQDIKNQIIIIQTASDQGHFQTLKLNKILKKLILGILKQTKDARDTYKKLRQEFEALKLKFRQTAKYIPLLGDDVDKLLADWIAKNNCPIPIARMGGGYYQFGSKKVYAKITNGKLLIRVGGGYMGIDEFMYYYGAPELNKMLAYDELDLDEDSLFGCVLRKEENKQNIISEFSDGRTVIGSQQLKRRLSPRQKQSTEVVKSPRIIPQKMMAPSPRQQTPMTQFNPKIASAVLRKSAQGLNSPRSSEQSQQNHKKSSSNAEKLSYQRSNSTQSNPIHKKITPRPFKEILIDDLSKVTISTIQQPHQNTFEQDDYVGFLKQNIEDINPQIFVPKIHQEEEKLNHSNSLSHDEDPQV